MKNRAVRFGVALVILIVVPITIDEISFRYLQRRAREYHQEIDEIRQREIDYRRPLVIDEPLEQNAANFYREAFPRLSVWRGDNKPLRVLVNAGAENYPADDSEVQHRCAEASSDTVRKALRSTSCDWELGFGFDDFRAFRTDVEAFALASCLSLDGHKHARSGDQRAAALAYLEAAAVGCDMGMGDEAMCIVAGVDTLAGLTALGRLVASINDGGLLDEIEQRLSGFETRLPDERVAMRRWIVWSENATSLDELAYDGQRYESYLGGMVMHVWTAFRLLRDDRVLRQVKGVSVSTTRDEGLRRTADLKSDSRPGDDELADWARRQVPTAVLGTFKVIDIYRATQVAIQLQRWRIAHGSYPRDASSIGAPDGLWGLRYEMIGDGRGYKLTGFRGMMLEVPAR